MEKTGNVFMDALVESGMQVGESAFVEWGSTEDFKFPFSLPRGYSGYSLILGCMKMYNHVRRTAKTVDLDWVISRNAVNTDPVLLTWMKSNTGLLRVVDDKEMSEFYHNEIAGRFGDVADYSMVPGSYESGLIMYIEYNVIEARFDLRLDMRKATGKYKDVRGLEKIIDILNWVADHRSIVEFIPIRVDMHYEVTHRAYRKGKEEVAEVKRAYLGDAIKKNGRVMDRLAGWFSEGNKIDPKRMYYILANKEHRSNYYLRRVEAGDTK